jgi:cytochrome c peroxidase
MLSVASTVSDVSLFYSFALAFHKLLELGVPASQWVTPQAWELQTLDEQETK